MTFGERVKKARERRGITQQEFADRLGYKNKSTITKIENDTNDVTRTKIIEMSRILGVSIGYLMGWEEMPEEEDPVDVLYSDIQRLPVHLRENVEQYVSFVTSSHLKTKEEDIKKAKEKAKKAKDESIENQ